jgi:hypothetical protein
VHGLLEEEADAMTGMTNDTKNARVGFAQLAVVTPLAS